MKFKKTKIVLQIVLSLSLVIWLISYAPEVHVREEVVFSEEVGEAITKDIVTANIVNNEIATNDIDTDKEVNVGLKKAADSEDDTENLHSFSQTSEISLIPVVEVATVDATMSYNKSSNLSKYRTVDLNKQVLVNVKDFGAKGDGITDDTLAIQSAINHLGKEGGIVYFPIGTFLCNNIQLKSNLSIVGDGWESILQQKSGLTGFQSLLGVNQGGIDTNQPEGNKQLTGSIKNILISNVTLKGTVDTEGFSQWVHLLSLNSCSNILIDTVMFEGFRGDAIFIGVESMTERHVSNVLIRNSGFDGINKENRNAISILDGSDITIEDNFFKRTTRSDMPGAIDIEPNKQKSIAWTILKDITIKNNHFSDIGTIAIVYSNPNYQSEMLKGSTNGINIEGNIIEDTHVGIVLSQAYEVMNDTIPKLNISVINNTIRNCFAPLQVQGIRGLDVVGNLFDYCNSGIGLGIVDTKVLDVVVHNNSFVRVGYTEDGAGILISNASRVTISDNLFEDCGKEYDKWNEGFAIILYEGITDNINIKGNSVTSPSKITTHFVYVAANHTLSPNTNTYSDNSAVGFKTSTLTKYFQ